MSLSSAVISTVAPRDTGKSREAPSLNLPRSTDTRYASWLLVRYANTDAGARPLPSGAVFWESPDVWVVSPLGIINQPAVGQPNQVFARVTNLGWKYATNVVVKFWWVDPSLAITEANAHLIGIAYANVPSGYTVLVPCPTPWVPVPDYGGHECLIAEAYSPIYDPLTAPMDPFEDRHVGQRNEHVLPLAPGQPFQVNLHAANIAGLQQKVAVELYALRLAILPPLLALRADALERTVLGGAKLLPPAGPLPVNLSIAGTSLAFEGASTLFARRLLSLSAQEVAGTAFVSSPPPQVVREAVFEPWEARTIEISGALPPDAKPGDSFSFRVLQRAGRMVTGGYTVTIVTVAPAGPTR